MTIQEHQRLALAIGITGFASSIITGLVIRRDQQKKNKKIVEVLDSYRDITQWTANNVLSMDREAFVKEFMFKATFHNIIVQEA